MEIHKDTIGFIAGTILLIIGIVGILGEWVFHWWNDPWEWAGPASVLLAIGTLLWSASSRDLRGFHREQRTANAALTGGQREQTAMLRNVSEGQREQTAMLRNVSEGQREQTSVLREMVTSFRRGGSP